MIRLLRFGGCLELTPFFDDYFLYLEQYSLNLELSMLITIDINENDNGLLK
jgi:hypothetical protein